MNIAELLTELGPENIKFQWLGDCLEGTIRKTKRGVQFSCGTSVVTVHDLAFGTGPVGMIVWVPRDKLDELKKRLQLRQCGHCGMDTEKPSPGCPCGHGSHSIPIDSPAKPA